MIKVMTVVGARPQFVKSATVSRILAGMDNVKEIIVHTGQHFDQNMSDIFFNEMQIPAPDHYLNVNSLGHGAMTGKMMEGLEDLMLKERPDVVLVYGDTNSTLAGALTAKKLHITVAHVEAGLRSFNMEMPEEVNRILTDRISDYLYCPTDVARRNLLKEGFENFGSEISVIGDVMYDAALFYAERAAEHATVHHDLKLENFALCTLHRAENTDKKENLRSICEALNDIHEKMEVVLPLHPRTRKVIEASGISLNVRILDPVGYFDMVTLLKNCSIVLTDSGGLQKEAYFFKKPCITMRDQTEWVELLEVGANVLTGADGDLIRSRFDDMLSGQISFEKELYGDGNAAGQIVEHLLSRINA